MGTKCTSGQKIWTKEKKKCDMDDKPDKVRNGIKTDDRRISTKVLGVETGLERKVGLY